MPFKIPEQTPAGQYLLRVDHVFNYWRSPAQLYPSCAHIEVESTASGGLPEGVKFPEAYEPDMPGENPAGILPPVWYSLTSVCRYDYD
jgi:hypothetical protein